MSFINAARQGGAAALLGAFGHIGKFDSCMKALTVVDVKEGFVRARFPVTNEVSNFYDTLHGGAASTLVDVLGTMAILSKDPLRPGVSVDLNVSFLSAAKVGETIVAEGHLLKMGRSLAFTQVNLLHTDGSVVATGRHTKAFPFIKKSIS